MGIIGQQRATAGTAPGQGRPSIGRAREGDGFERG